MYCVWQNPLSFLIHNKQYSVTTLKHLCNTNEQQIQFLGYPRQQLWRLNVIWKYSEVWLYLNVNHEYTFKRFLCFSRLHDVIKGIQLKSAPNLLNFPTCFCHPEPFVSTSHSSSCHLYHVFLCLFSFLFSPFSPPMFHLLSFILSSPLLHGVLCFMADSKRGRSFFCEWKLAPNELHCLSAPMVLELIFDAEISRWCKFSHSSRFAVCVCEWEMRNCAFVYVRARERGREESTCVSPNHSLLQCQPWPLISWLVGRQKQSPL